MPFSFPVAGPRSLMKITSWDEHSSVENKGTTLPSMISRKERFHQLRFAHIGSLMNIYHGKICQTSPYINKQTNKQASKQASKQTTKQPNKQTKILVSHSFWGETSQPTNLPPPTNHRPPGTLLRKLPTPKVKSEHPLCFKPRLEGPVETNKQRMAMGL